MNKKLTIWTLFFAILIFAIKALGVEQPPLYEDATLQQLVEQFVYIITNFKLGGTLAAISMVIIFLVNLLKSSATGDIFDSLGRKTKRLIITVLGVAVTIIGLMLGGVPFFSALVTGLFTTGGAVAIWEVLKPMISKDKK